MKSIITIQLALVAMAAQGQVKSGIDLCLRDEATGEWLIGLFDDYAIYDCEYWNYAEVGKDHVVLTKDGLRKEILLKKNSTIIDGSKHKTSVLKTKCLPDYPTRDETAWPGGINAEEDLLQWLVGVDITHLLGIILLYLLMNIAYCVRQKQIVIVDVFIIAAGYYHLCRVE